mgnify:CR=1 FL=1
MVRPAFAYDVPTAFRSSDRESVSREGGEGEGRTHLRTRSLIGAKSDTARIRSACVPSFPSPGSSESAFEEEERGSEN